MKTKDCILQELSYSI